jgi:hypothetical protein
VIICDTRMGKGVSFLESREKSQGFIPLIGIDPNEVRFLTTLQKGDAFTHSGIANTALEQGA